MQDQYAQGVQSLPIKIENSRLFHKKVQIFEYNSEKLSALHVKHSFFYVNLSKTNSIWFMKYVCSCELFQNKQVKFIKSVKAKKNFDEAKVKYTGRFCQIIVAFLENLNCIGISLQFRYSEKPKHFEKIFHICS